MKTIKVTMNITVADSTNTVDLISDLEDSLLCDCVQKAEIEYENNGVLETETFENSDFEG